ncbi:MAG: histidine phosphatase family protein [Desulfobacterota bacterium]|nr:histidine phosphatase family protein [Thermodesulfobacteriota bacterium]
MSASFPSPPRLSASHRELEQLESGRTRLYLVRHGELTTSQEWRYVGHSDVDMTEEGVAQMQRIAHYLQHEGIQRIICSDLRRTFHAACVIGAVLGIQPQPDPAFRELNLGRWEGMTRDEIIACFPEAFEERNRSIATYRIEGGESFLEVQARVMPRLDVIRRNYCGENILIVAHGGVNRVIICTVLGLSLEHLARIDQAYGCLNVIDFFDDSPVIRLLNFVPRT